MLTTAALQTLVTVQSFYARMRDQERGATAVEYGLLVALIAIVMAVGAALLGKGINNLFSDANDKLPRKGV